MSLLDLHIAWCQLGENIGMKAGMALGHLWGILLVTGIH